MSFLLCISILLNASLFSQNPVDSNKVIKVLSFNILHGATMKKDFNLDVIAKVIIEAKADFVALQEVDFQTNRAQKYDLATELGWRAKMAPIFSRAMPYDGGEYGEGVLSKYSFLTSRNVALPFSPGNEPRSALEITTVIPSGDTISFIGTHLDHTKDETDRVAQANEIVRVFKKNRFPTILAGDLNAEPNSRPMNIIEAFFKASYDKGNPDFTFPSDLPIKKIDYVLYYPENRWRVLSKRVICDLVASDHCAYLVTIELIN